MIVERYEFDAATDWLADTQPFQPMPGRPDHTIIVRKYRLGDPVAVELEGWTRAEVDAHWSAR